MMESYPEVPLDSSRTGSAAGNARSPRRSGPRSKLSLAARGVQRWAPVVTCAVSLTVVPFVDIAGLTAVECRLLGIMSAVVVSWLCQLMPIAATALMIGPLLVVYGITDVKAALHPYADPILFLFYGAFFIAAAMERHGLDHRLSVALTSLRWVKGNPLRTRLAATVCGSMLSMWISNTASAAILIPIVLNAALDGAQGAASGVGITSVTRVERRGGAEGDTDAVGAADADVGDDDMHGADTEMQSVLAPSYADVSMGVVSLGVGSVSVVARRAASAPCSRAQSTARAGGSSTTAAATSGGEPASSSHIPPAHPATQQPPVSGVRGGGRLRQGRHGQSASVPPGRGGSVISHGYNDDNDDAETEQVIPVGLYSPLEKSGCGGSPSPPPPAARSRDGESVIGGHAARDVDASASVDAPLSRRVIGDVLAVAYCCSVGGAGTLVGTPPNLIAVRLLQAGGVHIDFLDWLKVGLPTSIGMVAVIFAVFLKMFPCGESATGAAPGTRGTPAGDGRRVDDTDGGAAIAEVIAHNREVTASPVARGASTSLARGGAGAFADLPSGVSPSRASRYVELADNADDDVDDDGANVSHHTGEAHRNPLSRAVTSAMGGGGAGGRVDTATAGASMGKPWTRGEVVTMFCFVIAVIGWLTPPAAKLAVGETPLVKELSSAMHVGVVAMLASMPLFLVDDVAKGAAAATAARVSDSRSPSGASSSSRPPTSPPASQAPPPPPKILPWETAARVEWGLIMLFGGGISLGTAMQDTGLAESLGAAFVSATGVSSLWTITFVFTTFTVFFTEICSNTASANILVPLVVGVCAKVDCSPIPPSLGVALAASCAFMMPISTGPNAIAFATGRVPFNTMLRAGLVLNILGSGLLFLVLRLLCPLYGWDTYVWPQRALP